MTSVISPLVRRFRRPARAALPLTAAQAQHAADAERIKLRKRLRGAIIMLAVSVTYLIAFPVAAWSAGNGPTNQTDSLIQLALYLGGLSLLPFAVMTLTSFLRIVVVLSFLRSGLGTQNVPPNIVIIALALFLSLFVMGPTIDKINATALQPYQANKIQFGEAIDRATVPLKTFMVKQLGASSRKELGTFYKLAQRQNPAPCAARNINPETGVVKSKSNCLVTPEQFAALGNKAPYALPLRVVIPSFIISELKKAFIMGFAVLLPFLVIDMVISNILLSLGMFMLPPVTISLPFKILLFVLAGGWTLVIKFIVMGFNY
ncbi:MAG: flagellar biosynthetic protein FliP [Thermoleophilia bacterium]|nr:flagellar biosynthetic protein FliP [Thermoleophilia bacterium]